MGLDLDLKSIISYACNAELSRDNKAPEKLKGQDYRVFLNLLAWSQKNRVNVTPTEAGKRLGVLPQSISRSYRRLEDAKLLHRHNLGGYTIGVDQDYIEGQGEFDF